METDYVETVFKLREEWPETRLRQYILEQLRESCLWAKKKREEMEIENKEARVKGVSYAERKKYSTKIEALDHLFLKWRNRGIKYTKSPIQIQDIIQPEDLSYVQALGFEWHLRSAMIW